MSKTNLKAKVRRSSSSTQRSIPYETLEARQLLAADVVVQWNEVLLDAIRTAKPAPPLAARAMAIVHTAVFDAVNSICNGYKPYASMAAVHPMASQEAAAASAAARTLTALFPALAGTFASELANSLATVPDGIRENQGIAAGQFTADQILALRASDGFDGTSNYQSGNDPGDWRPTPPAFASPLLPWWGSVDTWAMSSGSQYRPAAPPSLDSQQYATDYNMVKSLGSATSLTRTGVQSEIARVWAGGPGTATPPGQWNQIAQDLADSQGNTLYENARMFAQLNIALADAAINAWDAKYVYDLWRPITAIQQGAADGNAATSADANWVPLLTTPPFPTYTSGHSTFSGAASTVLASFFGTDNLTFTLDSEVPGVPDRTFTSLRQAADEAGFSRIYGGIHFNFDNLPALAAGRQIGNLVATSQLQVQTDAVAQQSGHELYIRGTGLDDNIRVFRNGTDIVVRNHGELVGRYTASSLYHIAVKCAEGDDRVDLGMSLSQTAEVHGNEGRDKVFGSGGTNWLYGGAGNDALQGGNHNDYLFGGDGDDKLAGLGGNDVLDGNAGYNVLFGNLGDDTLYGKRNKDKLWGGNGNNQYIWDGVA
jgi:PAP2 superfamily/RTX calcium-binding nonapeptide repeat (4 copies)